MAFSNSTASSATLSPLVGCLEKRIKSNIQPLDFIRNLLDADDSDPVREMLALFAQVLMHHEASAACGAGYRTRTDERVNQRNGFRSRRWDTRAGTVQLKVPKLRQGSYFPQWLLEPRRRAERALHQVIVEAYVKGVSTRRVDDLVKLPAPPQIDLQDRRNAITQIGQPDRQDRPCRSRTPDHPVRSAAGSERVDGAR